jgi:uncharacterized LabA/DUF88 family protein
MSRVCVFIDGSNLYFALKRNNKNTRVDYYLISLALTQSDRTLIRTYYYNAVFDVNAFPEKAKNQQSFLDSLDRTPYLDLRLGRIVQNREGHRMEKGVDVRMASDMVYYAARDFYDIAIVLTEDQDFAPALALVKEMGKHIELAIFPDAQNREMVRVCDKLINLTEVVDKNSDKIFPPVNEKEEHKAENHTHAAPSVPMSVPPPPPAHVTAPPPLDEEDNLGNR